MQHFPTIRAQNHTSTSFSRRIFKDLMGHSYGWMCFLNGGQPHCRLNASLAKLKSKALTFYKSYSKNPFQQRLRRFDVTIKQPLSVLAIDVKKTLKTKIKKKH